MTITRARERRTSPLDARRTDPRLCVPERVRDRPRLHRRRIRRRHPLHATHPRRVASLWRVGRVTHPPIDRTDPIRSDRSSFSFETKDRSIDLWCRLKPKIDRSSSSSFETREHRSNSFSFETKDRSNSFSFETRDRSTMASRRSVGPGTPGRGRLPMQSPCRRVRRRDGDADGDDASRERGWDDRGDAGGRARGVERGDGGGGGAREGWG